MDRSADTGSSLWLLFPRSIRQLPADLAVVVAVTILTALVATVPVVRETPLRIVLGLPFVLFIPGYALIAALFPEAGTGPVDVAEEDQHETDGEHAPAARGIDGIERVALSFGLSIAIVPLIGLVLNFTPWGIRLVPILVGVGGVTLVLTGVASQRRNGLPPEERFAVPYRTWLGDAREELFEPNSRTDAALNVLLVLSILLATTSVAYAVAVPKEGESFSELYYLTESEDGELVADDYPTEFVRGESKPLVVGVGNHEHQQMDYTVVVQLQNVTVTGPNETQITVNERERLTSYQTSLADNETDHRTIQLQPTMIGQEQRVAFMLYRGEAPGEPSVETAYREVHLWVNVSEPAAG